MHPEPIRSRETLVLRRSLVDDLVPVDDGDPEVLVFVPLDLSDRRQLRIDQPNV